ncbi:TPM domain-containing protein [Streptomyces gibsoniae]|uniref:TPM domain-containing protein n=1 Tax=Streptomyces gibsoniae TaxID=3075529 RepID=A0ABU2TPH5_9ACTN|nr:TPM domain-containing protein [Streptomyces sp. DSM 41699]MDT0462844.1 TPM domain-containing protein [Streptomyces sp. DSM 41699]
MTPPTRRHQSCRAAAFRAVRRAPVAFGAVLSAVALGAVAGAGRDRTATGDLALPLIAAVAAVAVAVYTSVRRRRRTRTRTTPGGRVPTVVPLDELDRRARRLLVETDDCVRTSREELRWAAAQLGDEAIRGYAQALEDAASELATAFGMRQRLDEGEGGARALLEEIVARCGAAGRRLDAQAPGFDGARALERTAREALERAEARSRESVARVAQTDDTLTGLRERYALSACLPVAGHQEVAEDRLSFAASCLHQGRRAAERGETGDATALLRAAEAAVGQADLLAAGVARLASALTAAADALPGALTAMETDLARAAAEPARTDLRTRTAQGRVLVAELRREPGREGVADGKDASGDGTAAGEREAEDRGTADRGVLDPAGALRRIEEVTAGLDRASQRRPEGAPALDRLDRALLVARGSVGAASDYVTTHRGAVGCEARTRLAEAERRLRAAERAGTPGSAAPAPAAALSDAREADAFGRRARQFAERDVRTYGTPYGEGLWTGGAVLGGILLDAPRRPGAPGDGGPASYGGPATRARRGGADLFRRRKRADDRI